MQRALDASLKLIDSSLRTAMASAPCTHQRPLRTARKLDGATDLLLLATARLKYVVVGLDKMHERIARDFENAGVAPERLMQATNRFMRVAEYLDAVAGHVLAQQEDVLHGLQTGALVPEPPAAPRRPRIVLVPRPAPVRAFLRARQPRVIDRITPLLQRRRRTRRPATIRVPRRTSQGRAPPLSICLL